MVSLHKETWYSAPYMWLAKFPPLLPQSRIPKGPSPSCGALVCPTRSQSCRLPPDPRFSSKTLLLCPSEWETHNSTYSRLWPSYLPAVPLEFGGRGGQTRVASWSRAAHVPPHDPPLSSLLRASSSGSTSELQASWPELTSRAVSQAALGGFLGPGPATQCVGCSAQ